MRVCIPISNKKFISLGVHNLRTNQLKTFEKQLTSLAPHHLPRFYVVATSDDYERKKIIQSILSFVLVPDAMVTHCSGLDEAVRDVLEALNSPGLFSSEPVVVVDEADKKLFDSLAPHFKEPLTFGYLIIGLKSKASFGWVENIGVILDLMDEKPWDKEKRWTEQLHERARAAGKRLTPEAALWMIERLEHDAALLSYEMDKLLCYCADRSTIEKVDVEAICSASRSHTLWQIADDLVWNRMLTASVADMRDASFFHGLLAFLRQQLMIGAKMHELYSSSIPLNEWGPHFPKIWPKALEKKSQTALQLGQNYFRSGLDRLFEIELLSKNSTVPLDALLDFFRVRT